MQAARNLKHKIHNRELTLGLLCTFHLWLDLIEIAINAGLDYIIIDGEHHSFDAQLTADACAIGRRMDFAVLIRPAEADYDHVRQAADLGPCGFLLPQVTTADQLDQVRDAIHMPPRGRRRPGGPGNRWVNDYSYPTWKTEVEDDWIVLPQIESKAGLANVDAIARHEITTALAIGPYDLSADLGCCWNPADPVFVDAIAQIKAAADNAGKNLWRIGDPKQTMAEGATFLCIAEPIMLLENTLKSTVTNLRKGNPTPTGDDKPLP